MTLRPPRRRAALIARHERILDLARRTRLTMHEIGAKVGIRYPANVRRHVMGKCRCAP